jgi:uncharacterized protein (DUF1330 family)
MQRLREWYESPEYAEALRVRWTALARRPRIAGIWTEK